MIDAGSNSSPSYELDKYIVVIAVKDARKLMARGHAPEEAAALACPSVWSEWRGYVLSQLLEEGRE